MIRLAKRLAPASWALTVKLWQLFLLLVVLTGILVGVARVVLPELSAYREQAVVWAEELLGQPVSVSGMSVRWRGFGPQLILQDVALPGAEPGRSPRFAEIRIDFGLLDMLRTGAPAPRQITIVGARLQMERRADGTLMVAGLATAPMAAARNGAAALLPWRLSLRESELLWDDRRSGMAPLRLRLIEARFAHDGRRHQIDAELSLPEEAGRLRLAVDATGEPGRPGSWSARFYAASDQLRLPALLQPHLPEAYLLQQGQAGFELWGDWRQEGLEQLQGRLDLRGLRLSQRRILPPRSLHVERLAGRFQWRRTDQGWRFDAADIRFQQPDRPPGRESRLSLTRQQRALRIELDALALADARAVAAMLPLPDMVSDALAGLQPQALVTQLAIEYAPTGEPPEWRVSGRFKDLQTLPWSDLPGVKNLSGRIEAGPSGGALRLDSPQAALHFEGLFRAPLQLQRLSGLLQWAPLPEGGWRIQSDELTARNRDLETRTRLRMEIPPDGSEQSVFLDLQTDFTNGAISSTPRYLPTGIMDEAVVDWLERALVDGRLTSGSCVVRGYLRDFPFDNHQGRFEVLFGVEELLLDYFPGWPRLEEVTAEVRFLDNRFDVWILEGRLLDSEIEQAHGWIDRLSESTPFRLTGRVAGALGDNLRLLRETPLAADFAATVAGMRAEGEAQVAVDFAIPLSDADPRPFRIDGRVSFRDSTLHLDDWQLSLNRMRGDLLFDEQGIRAKGIQAQTLGTGVHVDLGASPDRPDATQITARAHLSMATLAQRFPGMALERLDGAADWVLQLDIPNRMAQSGAATRVTARSDLVGIAVDLPAPLGKAAADARPLQVSTALGAPRQPLQGRYGEILDLSLLLDPEAPGRLPRGEVRLGGGRAVLPDREELRLHVRLDRLDLAPWLERMEADSGAVGEIPFSAVDIAIKQLRRGEWVLNDVAARLVQEAGVWSGYLASRMFEGTLRLPADLKHGTVSLTLDRITLDYRPGEDEAAAAPQDVPPPAPRPFLDPRDFPAIHLESRQVLVNGQDLGPLALKVRKIPQGLLLEETRMASASLRLTARGHWRREADAKPETALKFDLELPAAGDLLADMAITRNIQGARAEISGDLKWEGGPHRVSIQKLTGQLEVDIGKGSILEVNPGIGRIFGLLNLTSLQRRLSLDFSDIYAKGFGFDRMQGRFELDDGNAVTEGFQIDGPAARILITGRVGLVERDLEQTIVVVPQVSSSVALATAIANPAAGAALLLAQGLMGENLDKITSYRYRICGRWDDLESSGKESLFFASPEDAASPEPPCGPE